jgi:ketosteroid isomerase-like protein
MTADETRASVERYYSAVNANDVDACAAMFAPGAAMRDPVGMPPATDDNARRQRYQGIALAFETFAITTRQLVALAGEAAATWSATGKTRTGRDVTFDGISTFIFDSEGRITQMSAYWDVSAIMTATAGG